MQQQPFTDGLHIIAHAQTLQVHYPEAAETAGADVLVGPQFDVHVDRETVIAAAAPDADTERRDLGVIDIHARCAGAPLRFGIVVPAQQVDNRLLGAAHEFAHPEAAAGEVEQEINHELAGTVVGHLSAPIRTYDRNRSFLQYVFG